MAKKGYYADEDTRPSAPIEEENAEEIRPSAPMEDDLLISAYPMAEAIPIVTIDEDCLVDEHPQQGRRERSSLHANPNYQAIATTTTTTSPSSSSSLASPSNYQNRNNSQNQQEGGSTYYVYSTSKIGRSPAVGIMCPYCHQPTQTRTRHHPNGLTWIVAMFLACCSGYCCLCFLPFCCTCCMETDHYCITCQQKISRVPPFSDGVC